jgi:elongation factor G
MAKYASEGVRNIALVGHAGSGKTTLGETLLFTAGATTRQGHVDDGTSILDYGDEERERKFTIRSSLAHAAWKDRQINLIDTPGYPDFVGEVHQALAAVETAVVVISATRGVSVNTRRLFRLAADRGLARFIVITELDGDNIEFEGLLASIQEQFGKSCQPLTLPVGIGREFTGVAAVMSGETPGGDLAAARDALREAIIESDDALTEKYLEGGEIDEAALTAAFRKGVASGKVVPILCVGGLKGIGIEPVLDALVELAPSPLEGVARTAKPVDKPDAEPVAIVPDPSKPFIAQVFKAVTDPFVGKLCYLRVFQGSFKGEGATMTNARTGKTARVAQFFRVQGKEQEPLGAPAIPGDIVAVAKVEDFLIGDTAVVGGPLMALPPIGFPVPMVSLAVEPKSRGDEQKIGTTLTRLAEEDLTFRMTREAETRELVVTGMSALHLDIVLGRLKKQFGVDVQTRPPRIPYHETITKSVKYVEYTHKKQTGGAGQYARVAIDMEPTDRGAGYEFVDEIYGGVIDQPFRVSVDKGIQKKMAEGVLAGYHVVDVRVKLVDGKTHPVDSKDIAFQIAGREAFKQAFMQCNPVLLEPIVNVEITVPSRALGDITGDLNTRRGRILGVEQEGNDQTVKATAPLAEMLNYSTQLRSMTGGEGSYTMAFSHYDIVPGNVQQQIVAAAGKKVDEEE